jgi:hypothetical protein
MKNDPLPIGDIQEFVPEKRIEHSAKKVRNKGWLRKYDSSQSFKSAGRVIINVRHYRIHQSK